MNYKPIIEIKIEELVKEFYENPHEFFNEHDFHHKFFCMLYPELKNLIHPEYPTRHRFIKERTTREDYVFGTHCFDPEEKIGVRGHYDFVIFDEEFYNKYNGTLDQFDRLSNKNVDIVSELKEQYIDFAFEFKYITGGSISVIKEIEFDIFKLKEAKEAKNKYLIIFMRELSKKGFKQLIEPLNKFKTEEKDIEIRIYSEII